MQRHALAGRIDAGADVSADHVLQRRCTAPVVHRVERHLGFVRQHDAGKMRRAAGRSGAEARLVRIGFAPLHVVAERLDAGWHRRPDVVTQHRCGGWTDRREVGQGIVAQRLEAVRIERHREVRREQHDAAVGLGVLHIFDGNARAGAGLILHQNGRGIGAAHGFGEHAGGDVGAAAGREADDHMNGLLDRLRRRGARQTGREQTRRRGGEQMATIEHGTLPSIP